MEKHFTNSPIGITGAVAGAVIGGRAAHEAQAGTIKSSGKGTGKHHEENQLLTLLGAVAGGLVVNATIDKYEEKKRGSESNDRGLDDNEDESDG